MSFLWPISLFSLFAIPLLVLLYLRIQKRRKQFAVRYGSLGLVQQASGAAVGSRRHLPSILFLLGLTVLFLALARPQMSVSLPQVEGIVILAFDVSGSMSATDFEPTRMEAAKEVGREFVMRQPSTVKVGIVSFSDNGFSMQLPTNDQEAILSSIDRLRPERGTSLANGIIISLNTIANATGQPPILGMDVPLPDASSPAPTPAPVSDADDSAVIVLLTDGENNMDPDPLAAAQFAADRGVRIHTIGVGSSAGIELEVNGFKVFTQLDEATLQQIAEITDGNYYNAQTEEDLQTIYENIDPQLVVVEEKTEVTAIFAGASILILLVAGMISLMWFSHVP
jgi:Ca-activated chloride channel family protein